MLATFTELSQPRCQNLVAFISNNWGGTFQDEFEMMLWDRMHTEGFTLRAPTYQLVATKADREWTVNIESGHEGFQDFIMQELPTTYTSKMEVEW